MGRRLYKEARELAPLLVGTLLFIQLPYLVWGRQVGAFGLVALGVGCVSMAAGSFGHEFQYRTLGSLLAQPALRRVFWQEKMLVLAVAMGLSVPFVWLNGYVYSVEYMPILLVLIPLCAFCGGPWLTLATQSGIAGAVTAVGFPVAIMAILGLSLGHWFSDEQVVRVILGALFAYSAVACCLGYSAFNRFELSGISSRELGIPAPVERWLAPRVGRFAGRFTGAFAALVKKELHVQQFMFVAAGIFVVAAVLGTVLFRFRDDWGAGILVAAYVTYMVLVPFLIGAIAVAEERQWGLAEWHLSLPPSGLKQWLAKSTTALGLTLVLGLAVPAAVFFTTRPLLGDTRELQVLVNGLHRIALGQLLLTSMALYTGSFSKSTLRAILLALVLVLALGLGLVLGLRQLERLSIQFGIWGPVGDLRGNVRFDVGLLVLTVLLQIFALGNFRLSEVRVWRLARQFGFLFVALVVLGVAATLTQRWSAGE